MIVMSYTNMYLLVSLEEYIVSSESMIWKNQLHPTSSLSPPPRQQKSKRGSTLQDNENTMKLNHTPANNNNRGRRPLIDPTLTPRVKPRSIKTKRQPSLLRLSLDAELLQSPDGDNDSMDTFKTNRSSNASSLTPISAPFRSGTLGSTPMNRLSIQQQPPLPPVPPIHIPLEYNSSSRPHSQSTQSSHYNHSDSPVSIDSSKEAVDDEEYEDDGKLTLKERRRRRSPLSLPNTDQLTLALKEMTVEKQELSKDHVTNKRQTYDSAIPQVYNLDGLDNASSLWRHQLLEQTLAFSFEDQSRQDAMMTLEGKKARAVSLRPIAPVEELDHHFDGKPCNVVRDKAQYDAVVSFTRPESSSLQQQHNDNDKRQSLQRVSSLLRARLPSAASEYHHEDAHTSHNNKQQLQSLVQTAQPPLEIICENQVATPTMKHIPHFTVAPETPPYHKQTTPSLISAPSTPNSIDSSVIDDDYMGNERLQQQFLKLSN